MTHWGEDARTLCSRCGRSTTLMMVDKETGDLLCSTCSAKDIIRSACKETAPEKQPCHVCGEGASYTIHLCEGCYRITKVRE